MFAPQHHQATRHVVPGAQGARGADDLQLPRPADQPGRRDAPADRRVRPGATCDLMAGALVQLGCRRALVVSSEDGMDEVSIVGETRVVEVSPEGITLLHDRAGAGRARARRPGAVAGGTPEQQRRDRRERARRRGRPAPRAGRDQRRRRAARRRQGGRASRQGVRLAEQTIDSGAAREALRALRGQDRRARARRT